MENGYVTEREEMVMEDGKYYPMMRVHFDASAVSHADSFTEEQELEFRYGKQLLTENIRCFWRISAGKRRSSRIF